MFVDSSKHMPDCFRQGCCSDAGSSYLSSKLGAHFFFAHGYLNILAHIRIMTPLTQVRKRLGTHHIHKIVSYYKTITDFTVSKYMTMNVVYSKIKIKLANYIPLHLYPGNHLHKPETCGSFSCQQWLGRDSKILHLHQVPL